VIKHDTLYKTNGSTDLCVCTETSWNHVLPHWHIDMILPHSTNFSFLILELYFVSHSIILYFTSENIAINLIKFHALHLRCAFQRASLNLLFTLCVLKQEYCFIMFYLSIPNNDYFQQVEQHDCFWYEYLSTYFDISNVCLMWFYYTLSISKLDLAIL
jgi:hypothetical protein